MGMTASSQLRALTVADAALRPKRPLPLAFSTAGARRAGYSPAEMRSRLGNGTWVRLRRGVYGEAASLAAARVGNGRSTTAGASRNSIGSDSLDGSFRNKHAWGSADVRAAMAAAVTVARPPVWLAGQSARWLYQLPECVAPTQPVHMVRRASEASHLKRHSGLLISSAGVPASHRAIVGHLPVLAVARVVVDSLRTDLLDAALMVGDAALRTGMIQPEDLCAVLADCKGWPGITQARWRALLLDGRRETPLESASVAMFVELGLPLPVPQYEVVSRGRLVGRSDFAWVAQRVLGEADGRSKYVDDLPGSPPPEERIWSERLRQDGLQEARWEVVRWTDRERRLQPAKVKQRILAAFARAEALGWTRDQRR